MSSVSRSRIVLLRNFGLEGLILCHVRGLAWIYLVQPPGTMTGSNFACACSCCMLRSVMWHLKESQANIRRVNENFPNTSCTQSRVRPSFIHLFTEEATQHLFLNYSLSCFVSLLAPGKTINRFSFAPCASVRPWQ